MNSTKITFIGGGNMARAIVAGLCNNGFLADQIWVTNPNAEKLEYFSSNFSVRTSEDNCEGAKQADIIVLAVKPNQVPIVLKEIKEILKDNNPLIISIAAGVTTEVFKHSLGFDPRLIRAISNTPAMVSAGATALFANQLASDEHRDLAESIFRAVGIVLWVQDEELLHPITALSGSGPAYFFLFMEVLEQIAESFGLSQKEAQLLILQTALGAARIAIESPYDVLELRKAVTSSKGTTEAAIEVFESSDFRSLVSNAISAAVERSKQLTESILQEKGM